MDITRKHLLVISPHFDDAEIGLGGMLSRTRKFVEVDFELAVCMSKGDYKVNHSQKVCTWDQRLGEQIEAMDGKAKTVHLLNLAPAARFDTVPIMDFVSSFDQIFPNYDEVFVPLPNYSKDHQVVWEAAMATLRTGVLGNTELFLYEQGIQPIAPSLGVMPVGMVYYVLDEDDIDLKVQLIAKHKSQFENRPINPYSGEAIKAFAQVRGAEIGVDYAEVVYSTRRIVFNQDF